MAKVGDNLEKQVMDEVRKGNYKPVYMLTGEEDYYIDLLSDFFENTVIDEAYRDFDQTVVYGRDVDMAKVLGLAKRYPMMSPVQLVLVKEAQDLGVGKSAKTNEDWDLLADYLNNPLSSTVLVFCYRHKKFDKRTRSCQAIKKAGVFYEHAKIYDNQLPTWIADYVRGKGYSITPRATTMLAEALGTDLAHVANELSKLFITLPKDGAIDENKVEREVGISKDYNVFELQKAIGQRDVLKCNKIVAYFADNPKNNPIQMVLPVLYGYIVKVMIYLQLTDKEEAASALKVSPFFVKDYAEAASHYTLPKLALCIGYIHEADLKSKGFRNTGSISDGEILKELIFKIIH